MRKELVLLLLLFAFEWTLLAQERHVEGNIVEAVIPPTGSKVPRAEADGTLLTGWFPEGLRKGLLVVDLKGWAVGHRVCANMPAAGNVTRVSGGTASGTVTIMVERRTIVSGSPTNVLSAGLVPDSTNQTSCANGHPIGSCDVQTLQNTAFGAGTEVCVSMSAESSPIEPSVTVELTF